MQGSRTFELSVTDTADLGLTPVGLQRTDIMIGGSVRMTSLGGELAGHVSNVNSAIPAALSTLDGVAAQLISDVNALHVTGEDLDGNVGGAFFSGTSAATISVDAAIIADPERSLQRHQALVSVTVKSRSVLQNFETQRPAPTVFMNHFQ